MRVRLVGRWIVVTSLAVAVAMGPAGRLAAQDQGATTQPVAADPVLLMNQAIEYYVNDDLNACVETLDVLLGARPQDEAARFFRAVVHGEVGAQRETQARIGPKDELARCRRDLADTDRIERAIDELRAAQRRSDTDQFDRAQESLLTSDGGSAQLEQMVQTLRATSVAADPATLEETRAVLVAYREQRLADLGRAVRDTVTADEATHAEYEAMRADLETVMDAFLARGDTFVRLVEGVVAIKLGQYAAQANADELVEGFLRGVALSAGRHQALAKARAQWLARAVKALELYLDPPTTLGAPPASMDRVQAEFYLSVVRYRQAFAPARIPGQAEQIVDEAALRRAETDMERQADRNRLEQLLPPDYPERDVEILRWLSYPTLYLGLIRTVQGRFDEARTFYRQAVEYDTGPDGTLSNIIPTLVERQEQRIREIEAAPPVAEFGEDVLIELRAGIAFDSNVILLGHDTSTPLDIGRSRDVVARGGVAAQYTLDLGKLDPGLDRWRIGLSGRASSTWHGDIREFNEQDYGASIAIERELISRKPTEAHGPLLAGLQYDYDYFLLGNDGFLRINRITPRLTLFTNEQRQVSIFEFRYEDRNYLEPLADRRFDRDGNYFAVRAAHSIDLIDAAPVYADRGISPWGHRNDPAPNDPDHARWLRASVGMEYGWDATIGDEFDADRFLVAAGLEVPLPRGVTLTLSGEWEWQDYRNASLIDFHRNFRNDFIQRYRIVLERRYVLQGGRAANRRTRSIDRLVMVLRGDLQFTVDSSNVEDRLGQSVFSYDRTVFGLSVSFLFN